MPELGPFGSVRGVPGNGHPYRDNRWRVQLIDATRCGERPTQQRRHSAQISFSSSRV